MKRVIFIRHAKSSWADVLMTDKERPLNNRGKRDAPIMSNKLIQLLQKESISVDYILCSTAKRTMETIAYFTSSNFKSIPLLYDDNLYHADEDYLLESLFQIDDKHNTVIVCAHNPGITFLANSLGVVTDNIPTCGIYAVDFKITSWTDIDKNDSHLSFYIYPKMLDNE